MADEIALWQRFRKYLYQDRGMGFALDISRVRFEDDFLSKMAPAMAKALANLEALEAGSIANSDEDRMVGHYWLRNPDRAPSPEIAQEILRMSKAIQEFAESVRAGRIRGSGGAFEFFLVIGIGGSALGPQFITQALGNHKSFLEFFYIDNTDPDGFDRVLGKLRSALDRTLVVVISKSGSTPETRNGMIEVRSAFQDAGLEFGRHAVAITGKESLLDRTAQSEGWLARFPMWDWVGGRTSVTSAVGLLPAALLGIDVARFLAGAAAMDEATRRTEISRNPAALLALMWYFEAGDWRLEAGGGKKDMVLLPYKDRLELLGRYLQQLVMESLGKELDREGNVAHQGITVYGNKGSTDQHAFVQQLRDGPDNFFVTFIEVLGDHKKKSLEVEPGITAGDYLNGFLQGTRAALYEKGRDSILISIEEVSPASIGQLIALFERTVGLYAELIDINAYHQPGVEAGKRAARAVLDLQLRVTEHLRSVGEYQTAEGIADAIECPQEVETIFRILEHLASNERGIQTTHDDDPAVTRYRLSPD